jgi:hypothetical protein
LVTIWIDFSGNFLFCLDPSVSSDMVYSNFVIQQYPANQQTPVAGGGIFLGAKHGDIVVADSSLQPRQAILKKGGCRDAIVKHMPFFIVKLIPFGAPPQFPSEIEVSNPGVLKGKF